jgi:CRISPR-associated protein Csd1
MLLQALYKYSQKHRLLDELPLQKRMVHLLIPIDQDGRLRANHFIPLTQQNEKGKEVIGQERIMPRFPGENNGGKSYFLAEGTIAVFGRDKETGETIPAPSDRNQNSTKAFLYFWEQMEKAYKETQDLRLKAILNFRTNYYSEMSNKIVADLPFLVIKPNKENKPILYGSTGIGEKNCIAMKQVTIGFQIESQPLTLDDEKDPLRPYWFTEFINSSSKDDAEKIATASFSDRPTVCLLTGETGVSIARSHKPKILGVPGLTSGGYIVSFAREAPAFSSYGFEMGQNAPVAENAAADYALAVNRLLDNGDTCFKLGPVAFCFWAKENEHISGKINRLINQAYPEQVADFLKSPFSGKSDAEIINRDRFYMIGFSGNAGRVVVQYWIEQSLVQALTHFKIWWDHLHIIPIYNESTKSISNERESSSSYGIPNLARVLLRRSKKQKNDKLVADRMVRLYRAAFEGIPLAVSWLKPILDEFQSAMLKDSNDNKTYPLSTSRFALIKLILIRNRKDGDFMPTYELADTKDEAYNCGRLLAVLEALQKRSLLAGKEGQERNNVKKLNAGVIQRYYGRASTAPSLVFPLLLGLSRHHFSKLEKGNDRDKASAKALERLKAEIMSKFEASPNEAPKFKKLLTLEEQGKFALGFYQQKAFDFSKYREYLASKGKEGSDLMESDVEEDNIEIQSEATESI